LKSGSINLLETSEPVQTCTGIALPLSFTFPTNNTESWLQVHGLMLLPLQYCTKNNTSKFRPRIHETIRE